MTSMSEKRFISDSIDNALRRRGLACDGPLRNELESRAEIHQARDPEVRARDAADRIVTLDQWLDQIRSNPKFSPYFPAERPRISRFDEDALRDNFAAIARGE